jgi:hypothetical protein
MFIYNSVIGSVDKSIPSKCVTVPGAKDLHSTQLRNTSSLFFVLHVLMKYSLVMSAKTKIRKFSNHGNMNNLHHCHHLEMRPR